MSQIPYFNDSYEESKRRFISSFEKICQQWPQSSLKKYIVDTAEDLTIDWIEASSKKSENLLIITTGEHGIEAFLGSAVIQMLIDEYIPRMNPDTTGLALVHTINPWGMKYQRRTNKANVDLNRNFVLDPMALDRDSNPDYARLNKFLNPKGKIWSLGLQKANFLPNLLFTGLWIRNFQIRKGMLIGQYAFPDGIYYGGRSIQPETRVLMDLYQQWYRDYDKVVHIDIHSGYGPRYRMSIVNSHFETGSNQDFQIKFDYPLVTKTTQKDFYEINGDMIDYLYQFMDSEHPEKIFYATCFEFGTLGEKMNAQIKALETMIFENQAFHYGTLRQPDQKEIEKDFMEMFYPGEDAWRKIALDNARQAFNGILRTWGLIGS